MATEVYGAVLGGSDSGVALFDGNICLPGGRDD